MIAVVVLLVLAGSAGHDENYKVDRAAFFENVQKNAQRGDLILCPDGQVWHYLAGLTIQRAPGLPVTTGDTLEVRYQPGMKLIRYQPTAMWAEYAHKYLAK